MFLNEPKVGFCKSEFFYFFFLVPIAKFFFFVKLTSDYMSLINFLVGDFVSASGLCVQLDGSAYKKWIQSITF